VAGTGVGGIGQEGKKKKTAPVNETLNYLKNRKKAIKRLTRDSWMDLKEGKRKRTGRKQEKRLLPPIQTDVVREEKKTGAW